MKIFMGCWISRTNRDNIDEKLSLLPNNIPRINIGENVRKVPNKPTIVFIFGGPLTAKGTIIDELLTCYGFKHIDIMTVIVEELCEKPRNSDRRIKMNRKKRMIMHYAKKITTDWILNELRRRLTGSNKDRYLVDIVPNTHSKFLAVAEYTKTECSQQLKQFERDFPISFAINLIQQQPRKTIADRSAPRKQVPSNKLAAGKNSEITDEADLTKLERRMGAYDEASKYFLLHFSRTKRLVSVGVSACRSHYSWVHIALLLDGCMITKKKRDTSVFLFQFTNAPTAGDNIGKNIIHVIELKDFSASSTTTPAKLIQQLIRYISQKHNGYGAFIVDLKGTKLDRKMLPNNTKTNKLFANSLVIKGSESFLQDHVVHMAVGGIMVTPAGAPKLQTYLSPDGDTFLFPQTTNANICSYISHLMVRFSK